MSSIDVVHMPDTFLCILVSHRYLRWALVPVYPAIVEGVRLMPAFCRAVGQRSGLAPCAITADATTSYLQSNGCHCENMGTTPSLAEKAWSTVSLSSGSCLPVSCWTADNDANMGRAMALDDKYNTGIDHMCLQDTVGAL